MGENQNGGQDIIYIQSIYKETESECYHSKLLLAAFAKVCPSEVVGQNFLSPTLLSRTISFVSAAVRHVLGWLTPEFWAHFPVSSSQIATEVLGLQMWTPCLTCYTGLEPGTQVIETVQQELLLMKPTLSPYTWVLNPHHP